MPVTYQDIISLPLTEADVLQAIGRAQHSHLLDNLRLRHPNIQFDCKVRGFIGEIALKNWFATYNIHFEQVNYMEDQTGIDIDFVYGPEENALNIEIKTSLIPDEWRNLQTCVQKGDIKLIRRGRQTIEQLKGDMHLQIYYRQRRKAKDRWLSQQATDLQNWKPGALYERLLGRAYLDNIFFVAWTSKNNLVQKLSRLPIEQSTWQFPGSQRRFWKCPIITQANKPQDLIQYLASQTEADYKYRAA